MGPVAKLTRRRDRRRSWPFCRALRGPYFGSAHGHLATGTENRRPDIDPQTHRLALDKGQLRYCPVCDAFEAIDQAIGVIGADARGVAEARFLRTYSDNVSLLAAAIQTDDDDRAFLDRLGIGVEEQPLDTLHFGENGSQPPWRGPPNCTSYTVYPALGSDTNDLLAKALGLEMGDGCCIVVDGKRRTSRKGIYAAGDVSMGSIRSASRWDTRRSQQPHFITTCVSVIAKRGNVDMRRRCANARILSLPIGQSAPRRRLRDRDSWRSRQKPRYLKSVRRNSQLPGSSCRVDSRPSQVWQSIERYFAPSIG